jgi:hypothetical protein
MLLKFYMKKSFTHSGYWLLYVVNIHPNIFHFMNVHVQVSNTDIHEEFTIHVLDRTSMQILSSTSFVILHTFDTLSNHKVKQVNGLKCCMKYH